jgi:hypothetical protein
MCLFAVYYFFIFFALDAFHMPTSAVFFRGDVCGSLRQGGWTAVHPLEMEDDDGI